MTITISDEVCSKYGLTMAEVLALTIVKSGADVPSLFANLEEKKALVKDMFGKYLVTMGYDERMSSVLLDSDKYRQPEDRIEQLALKMMAMFPAQKKAGSSQYFRGNRKDVTLRLKKFFKLYGNTYTDEQILAATKQYVDSFNGNYTYMRVLKYFIWKDERKIDSEGNTYVSEVSDLASYMENEAAAVLDSDWTSILK